MDSLEHFRSQLAETIAWCAAHDWITNPAEGLRTAALRPEFIASEESVWDWAATHHQRHEVVEQLAIKRAIALQEQNVLLFQIVPPLRGGRLLVFYPDGSLSDGAASVASDGFFDDDNIPAWDTWIAYVTDDLMHTPQSRWNPSEGYLLSWVPEPLVNVVTRSIEVNPEESIFWASNLASVYIDQFRQAGLVE